ncbi:MAG: tetratricopeptide repeat protein [Verrucomicrobiia bacterium]
MNARLYRNLLIFFVCSAWSAGVFAVETNSLVSSLPLDAANGFLQVQQQLHDTQLAIEHNRQQVEAETRRNAEDMAARLDALQQMLATQRQGEIVAEQKTQQFILILGGTFGALGLAVLLVVAYLQWRAVAQLVEMFSQHPAGFVLEPGRLSPSLAAGDTVQQSNAQLFSMVDHLEKRILELKQATRAPLQETTSAAAHAANGAPQTSSDRDECVANLIDEGQVLLTTNEPQKALECFDVALGLHPKHAEALVKKGGALEKLGRLDEAIACYDQAIEADGGMTIAYLHKGGLFNRLSRYDEALQCYERALQTQEKKATGEEAAA